MQEQLLRVITRRGPTKACALPLTIQALPSPISLEVHNSAPKLIV